MICDRCGTQTNVHTMSRFNTETICPDCEDLERAHPRYEEAVRVEADAVRQGNYNFPGIGLPSDLFRR